MKKSSKSSNEFIQFVRNKQIEEVKQLLLNKKKKALYLQSLDGNGLSPIHIASANGDNDMINLLVRNEFPLNVRDETHQWNPVHWALSNAHFQTCILLVCLGCNHLIPTKSGATALHFVAKHESQSNQSVYLQLLKFLIKRNADPNATNNLGESPIHVASFHGNDVALKYFVAKGGLMNQLTNAQESALHYAVRGGHLSTIKLLVDWKSDLNVIGKYGSLLDVAISARKDSVIRYLEELTGTVVNTTNNFDRLKRIIEHPEFCMVFLKYLEKSHSEENLDFYIRVEAFKRIKDRVLLQAKGERLIEDFILPSAKSEINIDASIRSQLLSLKEYTETSFDEAQDFIWKLLATDIYPKFIATKEYKSYCEGKSVLKSSDPKSKLSIVLSKHFNDKMTKKNNLRKAFSPTITFETAEIKDPKETLINSIKEELSKENPCFNNLNIFQFIGVEEFLSYFDKEVEGNLQSMNLSNNHISDKEIPLLFHAFQSSFPNLLHINLSNNQISNWGAYCIIDLLLNTKHHFNSVHLTNNFINPSIERQIFDILQSNEVKELNRLFQNEKFEFSNNQEISSISVINMIPFYASEESTVTPFKYACKSKSFQCTINAWGCELTIIDSNTPKVDSLIEQIKKFQSLLIPNFASIFFFGRNENNIILFSEEISKDVDLLTTLRSYSVNNYKPFFSTSKIIQMSVEILNILLPFVSLNVPLYFFQLDHFFIQSSGKLSFSFVQRNGQFPLDTLASSNSPVDLFLLIFITLLNYDVDALLLEIDDVDKSKNRKQELITIIQSNEAFSIFSPLEKILSPNYDEDDNNSFLVNLNEIYKFFSTLQ